MAWLKMATARLSASGADQSICDTSSSPFVPIFTSQLPGLHFFKAATSAGGWVRPFKSSSFAGVEKRPISGISGTCRNFCTSRARVTSRSTVPAAFTTPKAAISAFSVVGSIFVTTSPFSMAESWASSSWITFRRNGRGGGSWALTAAGGARASRPAKDAPARARFQKSRPGIDTSSARLPAFADLLSRPDQPLFLHLLGGGGDEILDQLDHHRGVGALARPGPDQLVLAQVVDERLHVDDPVDVQVARRIQV